MKYLSFDIEATGLEEHDLMIEFAAVPIDSKARVINEALSIHSYIKCPTFDELKPKLNPWVQEHNKDLITRAHNTGVSLIEFKDNLKTYLTSKEVQEYFQNEKIILFGKSMNAIDLPFLNRDLGWEWMRKYFSHRTVDFTSLCYGFIDQGILKEGSESGSELMKFLGMGSVAHTALEDAINTAKMYFKVLDIHKP